MNRCPTEGRKAFLARVAGIEAGSECERLAPLLSKLVDGEAGADDLAALRPHIRTCLACRAALREYRAAPRTAAALVPTAASDRFARLEAPARAVEGLAGWTHKAHNAVEMASAQKVAAVAASTAVIAGGGAAITVLAAGRPAHLGLGNTVTSSTWVLGCRYVSRGGKGTAGGERHPAAACPARIAGD